MYTLFGIEFDRPGLRRKRKMKLKYWRVLTSNIIVWIRVTTEQEKGTLDEMLPSRVFSSASEPLLNTEAINVPSIYWRLTNRFIEICSTLMKSYKFVSTSRWFCTCEQTSKKLIFRQRKVNKRTNVSNPHTSMLQCLTHVLLSTFRIFLNLVPNQQ